jgi:cytochrome c oxidase cbb3-type subunit I
LLGGALYLTGMLVMAWNTWKTLASGKTVPVPVPPVPPALAHA